MRRSTRRGASLLALALVVVVGCSSGSDDAAPDRFGSTDAADAGDGDATSSTEPEPTQPQFGVPAGEAVSEQPSGFAVTRLPEGEKPPQFVVVSFDGAGWHEKWDFWSSLQDEVPFRFTGFLSGTYLLSEATKDHYTGPGHATGRASIAWAAPEDVPVLVEDLNAALARGDEIGTHFNGHFCSDNRPGADDWSTADWNSELDQFFSFITDVGPNNGIEVDLDLQDFHVTGARTQCLEGDPSLYYPAYQSHGLVYDSSPARSGISWPTKDPTYGVWDIAMATFPLAGTERPVITMDYNFWIRQRNGTSGTPEESAADKAQVVQTYRDMYNASFASTRAPLILGNHFNEWNNSAYADAVAEFVLETCGKPDTYCVPFHDLVAWLEAQDPATIERLQALPTVMTPTPPELAPDAFGGAAPTTVSTTTTESD